MSEKFSKLRFREFAKAAAAGAIVGAVALQPVPANAATGSVQINAGGAHWFVNTNITFSTTSSGGLAISSASLQTVSGTRFDAFDGALAWHVNASAPGNLIDGGYTSPGGTVSVTANSVIGTTQVLAGLNVHAELFFSSNKAVARSVLVLQNPSVATITAVVDNDTNMGSDTNTHYQLTSSGDATFDASDNWTVSSETASPTTINDPILTFAFAATGAAVRPMAVQPIVDGSDKQFLRYNVTVPAGETRRVMEFVQMSDTVAHAEADATVFNSNASLQASDYLTGLSPSDEAQIVNWILNPTSVPTLGQWALAGMAGLLGLVGLGSAGIFGRRRHRSRAAS